MPIRKTQVPVKKLPPLVEWFLKAANSTELEMLQRMSRPQDVKALAGLLIKLNEYNMLRLMQYKFKDEKDLAYFRQEILGEKIGLDTLLYAVQAADAEIERRKKGKKA